MNKIAYIFTPKNPTDEEISVVQRLKAYLHFMDYGYVYDIEHDCSTVSDKEQLKLAANAILDCDYMIDPFGMLQFTTGTANVLGMLGEAGGAKRITIDEIIGLVLNKVIEIEEKGWELK